MTYHPLGGASRQKQFNSKGVSGTVYAYKHLLPTSIRTQDNTLITEGTYEYKNGDFTSDTIGNKHHSWLFFTDEIDPDEKLWINCLLHGSAIPVSDGSFFEEYDTATAAWCLADSNFKIYNKGTTIVPGDKSTHSSFRSEITGLLAILEKVSGLCIKHQIALGEITIYCDNLTAVTVLNEWKQYKMNPSQKNADVISACLSLRDSINVSFKCKHIYGHQDRSTPYHLLSPAARLNITMDSDAKALAETIIKYPGMKMSTFNHPNAFAPCYYKSLFIGQNLKDQLYKVIIRKCF